MSHVTSEMNETINHLITIEEQINQLRDKQEQASATMMVQIKDSRDYQLMREVYERLPNNIIKWRLREYMNKKPGVN
jgi:hypothetical protein